VYDEGHYSRKLATCRDLPDIFELVKQGVRQCTGRERGGLMLGLADLGARPDGFVGAYYPLSSNIIVMNELPLRNLRNSDPGLIKPYSFHILLHEYLHALGMMDEVATRAKVKEICSSLFGEEHSATRMSTEITDLIPRLIHPEPGWEPEGEAAFKLVPGFDRSSTDPYIG
jgi:hypothetical protein